MGATFAPPKKTRSFRTRCGECQACVRDDCGQCNECVRKKKFGGDGSSKQACLQRRCPNLQPSANSSSGGGSNNNNNNHSRAVATVAPASNHHPRQEAKATTIASFRRPASLLEERSLKRARSLSSEQATKVPPFPSHLHGLPIPEKRLGVCGRCGKDEENEHETILLCDGEGCGKEFHLKCCIPPIQQIPEEEYFCFDCSPKGSTAQLEEYLEEHEKRKDELDDPDMLVDLLLEEDINQEHPVSTSEFCEYPRSELDWIHQKCPESLIGKPMRLYCPKGNHYHNGRILDVRGAKRDTECLVRFPAGKDYRKAPLTLWIRLEEHCLAVATKILWGKFGAKERSRGSNKSPASWMRAKLWSRTARELVPVMKLLSHKQGQLYYRDPKNDEEAPIEPEWGLIETFGTDLYELLLLSVETRESPPQQQKLKPEREVEVMMALAKAEELEQSRIRKWKKLPMTNPMHPAAIRCQDEYALGPLEYKEQQKQYIQPSPLIPLGLDRAYILAQVSFRLGIEPSKDFAASLVCELVDSAPSTIRATTQSHRRTATTESSEDPTSSDSGGGKGA